MIKLKSLFRRGQGPSQGISSKHSNSNSNNNCNKSQSIQSINTTENENNQQHKNCEAFTGSVIVHTTRNSECNEDDSHLTTSNPSLEVKPKNSIPTVNVTAELHAHTLPHKKQKGTTPKKGQKQRKQSVTSTTAVNTTPTILNWSTINDAGATPTSTMATLTQIARFPSKAICTTPDDTQSNRDSIADSLALTHKEITPTVANNTSPTSNVTNDTNALNSAYVAATATVGYELSKDHQKTEEEATAKKMGELEIELVRLSHEKLLAETRITELLPYQGEAAKLKAELIKMQSVAEKLQLDIANLKYENESLRNRLRDVVNSPLSDAEKHQIIQDSQRLHSSAPASIALPNNATDNEVADGITAYLLPEWDKHSSSSEVSVACLQDKIIQMEETHYSTNEELQATLQELADLQAQLSDAQVENERLVEEKDVLFQSLCRQTEKLNESRSQINNLQEMLLRDTKQSETVSEMVEGNQEREKKLLDLIRTAQNEREAVLIKQEELNAELQELRHNNEVVSNEQTRLRERISLLESTIETEHAQRKQLESQILMAKEEISQRIIEIDRLTTLLENAKSKIEELEQDLARGDKTDLSDLLDSARKEKDILEERVATLQEQYARSQAEIRRLKEQLVDEAKEIKIAKNNAKCALSHLEYRLGQLQLEKDRLSADHQQLCENTAELQVQCKCHLEDKAQFQTLLSESQKHLVDVERKLEETQKKLEEVQELRQKENEEWQQFQADLLMTVRVANDFKTEALSAREQLVLENKIHKEKIRMLEQQIEKLAKQQQQQNETQQSVLSTVQQEMASRRNKLGSFSRQDSRLSVKTLIESIENNKQNKLEEATESHYSSSSSLNNVTPEARNTLLQTPVSTNDWPENVNRFTPLISSFSTNVTATTTNTIITNNPIITASTVLVNSLQTTVKSSLREQQQQQQQSQQLQTPLVNNIHLSNLGNMSKSLLNGERKDPLNMLAKNGGSKRNALLKWCQNKTVGYRNIDITNFSSSWNDGLAFCAILHSYLPDRIPYDTLSPANKKRNFTLAFAAAESVGIPTTLNIIDMCQIERPDWTHVMSYVTAIYKHFET